MVAKQKLLSICSKHFVDLKPTEENPNPTLHLGYEKVPFFKKRKLPADRSSINSKRAKKSWDHFSETINEPIDQPAASTMNESMNIAR